MKKTKTRFFESDDTYESRIEFLIKNSLGITKFPNLIRYLIDKECGENIKNIKIKRYKYEKPTTGNICKIHNRELGECYMNNLTDNKGVICMDSEKNLKKVLISE